MADKTYRGYRSPHGRIAVTVTNNETNETKGLDPNTSQRLFNHSPDGFNWGYAGSGPAQLALAILLDHFSENEAARRAWFFPEDAPRCALDAHNDFKFFVVSGLPEKEWSLTSLQIRDALYRIKEVRNG